MIRFSLSSPLQRLLRSWLGALLASLALASVSSAQSGSAIVAGSVTNAATRAFLEGAQVSLAGTAFETLTTRDGQFELTGVPPGDYTLEVRYTGLDTVTQKVGVSAGRNSVPLIGLQSSVYQLEKFTVSGEREGSAAAITAQRNASNVKSVVATDAFGHVVDGNIGEMLKRVSGIATNLNEGEVDQVFVRGIGSAFSSVTLDGTKLPSPAKGKKDRNFEVDKLPADYIESIEVIKAPTPDMDADSIGGAVNMITKSAFAIAGRRISYNFGLNHKTLRDKNSFFGGIQYSDVIGPKRNLGVYFSFGYSDNYVPQDVTQMDFERAYATPAYLWRFRLEDAVHKRNRTGAGLKLDYRWSPTTTLFTSFMFNHYTDVVDQKRLTIQAAENRTAYAPGYTDTHWDMNTATWTYQVSLIKPKQETFAVQSGAKHKFGDLKIDYSGSIAPAKGEEQRQNFDLALANQRTVLDRSRDVWYPTYTNLTPGDPNDYNRYNRGRIQSESGETKEAIWGGELNVEKRFATDMPFTLKGGARYRGQKTDVDSDRVTSIYVGPNGVQGGGDDNLNQFQLLNYDHKGFDGRYSQAIWPDVKAAEASFRGQRNLWDDDLVATTRDSLSSDGKALEEIYATYAMGTVDVGQLRIMGGVRMERTDVTGTGVVNDAITPALPGTAPEDQRAERARQEYRRVKKSSGYTNYFPGIHFRYELRRGVMARASYTTSLARPNFGDLMPDTTIDDPNLTISQNNTSLRAQEAQNFDVSLEYYFEPAGVLSIGAFQKNIENFIFNEERVIPSGGGDGFGSEYAGYALRTKRNGGEAKVKGLEFSYSQQLTFLPNWARGVSAFATYTIIDAVGNYNSQGAVADGEIAQFVPSSWNLGLNYQNHGFTIRAQLNYNDRFLNGYAPLPAERIYDDERYDGELRVKYQFNKRLAIFCDWTNALDQTVVRVQGKDLYRPQKVRYNGMRLNFGVSGTF
ncbi:MAG: TonB-dependent receptor [Verrucomicrobiota bacterium]